MYHVTFEAFIPDLIVFLRRVGLFVPELTEKFGVFEFLECGCGLVVVEVASDEFLV